MEQTDRLPNADESPENPFEYRDYERLEPEFPLFRRPASTAQHLVSLVLLLMGVYLCFAGVLLLTVKNVGGGYHVVMFLSGVVAAAVGFGLHRDRYWAMWGVVFFFGGTLFWTYYEVNIRQLLVYLFPAAGIASGLWLIKNYGERCGR